MWLFRFGSFLRALLCALAITLVACGGGGEGSLHASSDTKLLGERVVPAAAAAGAMLEIWRPYDFTFNSSTVVASGQGGVAITATFTLVGGGQWVVPGFYSKTNTWVVRFSPPSTGQWSYQTESTDPNLDKKSGTFNVIANSNPAVRGFLQIDGVQKTHFRWEDGTPFFLMGYALDNLASLSIGDETIKNTKQLVDMVANHGFTEILMAAYVDDTTWAAGRTNTFAPYDFGPAAQYPFEGTLGKLTVNQVERDALIPNFTKPNHLYWENLDRVMDYLHTKGISVHLYLRGQSNKYLTFVFPNSGSSGELAFMRYVIARYQAYPNVVFSYQKEIANVQMNAQSVVNGIGKIKQLDAYRSKRLTTAHDYDAAIDTGIASAQGTTTSVVAGSISFFTDQHHTLSEMYSRVRVAQSVKEAPYYNAEMNYQVANTGTGCAPLRSCPADGTQMATFGGSTQSAEWGFQNMLEIYMAGGYAAYYYGLHAWDVMVYDETPRNLAFYRNLANFFKQTKWQSLKRNDALITDAGFGKHVLADPGMEYIVYLNKSLNTWVQHNTATLTVNGVAPGAFLRGVWWNLHTGQTATASIGGSNQIANGVHNITRPATMNGAPVALHLVSNVVNANRPPVVSAGSNIKLVLPENKTLLKGSVSDDDLPLGSVVTQTWSLESGPGAVTFSNPNAANTTVTFSVAGTYKLKLTAFDTMFFSSANVDVEYGAVNKPPVVSAGENTSLNVPGSTNIYGSVSDDGLPAGVPLSTTWTQVSGPAQVSFGNANVASTTAIFPVAGTYQLRLAATDSLLASESFVTYQVGTSQPLAVNGLNGRYYSNTTLTEPPAMTRVDSAISFSWGTGAPHTSLPSDRFSVRWTGFVQATVTGTYTFFVRSNDGNRLWVNNTQLTNRWSDGASEQSGTIALLAGQKYPIILEVYESANSAEAVLSWTPPNGIKQVIGSSNLWTN